MVKNIFLLVMAGTGIVLLAWGFGVLKHSGESLNWPRTKGTVISSSLTINHLPKFMDFNADPMRWYGTEVQYEYSVNDQRYASNKRSFFVLDTRTPQAALKVMNSYRRQHEVTVYYDPVDPREAVLEPGDNGDVILPLLIGGILAFLGLSNLFGRSLEFQRGVDSYIHQGFVYENQGKIAEALREYSNAIRIDPYFAPGYSSRGELYLQQKDWDRAITDLKRALEIDLKNGAAYFALAKAYLGKKEYDLALVNMNKAREVGFPVGPEILEDIKKELRHEKGP